VQRMLKGGGGVRHVDWNVFFALASLNSVLTKLVVEHVKLTFPCDILPSLLVSHWLYHAPLS